MARKYLAILAVIIMGSPAHSAADRASLLPQAYRACEEHVLNDREFLPCLGTVYGLSLRELCDCQVPSFISVLSDADVTVLQRSWSLTSCGPSRFRWRCPRLCFSHAASAAGRSLKTATGCG